MPSPPNGKRARTNDHPGLVVKRKRRTKAEMAAEKATKADKANIAAAAEEKILTELAEIELEQEKMNALQRKAVIRAQPAADTSTGMGTADGLDEVEMVIAEAEDLTDLIDKEIEGFVDDDDDDEGSIADETELGPKKGMAKGVSSIKCLLTGHGEY